MRPTSNPTVTPSTYTHTHMRASTRTHAHAHTHTVEYRCDCCGMDPIIGVRFECSNVADIDLCSVCTTLPQQSFSAGGKQFSELEWRVVSNPVVVAPPLPASTSPPPAAVAPPPPAVSDAPVAARRAHFKLGTGLATPKKRFRPTHYLHNLRCATK